MNTIKYIMIVSSMMLAACGQSSKQLDPKYVINVEKFRNNTLELESLGIKTEFLIIDDTDAPIGNIKDICSIDNMIYILDGAKNSILIIDSKSGNIVNSVNKMGKGQGEYMMPSRMKQFDNRIYILDTPSNKILLYDKNMNYIDFINLPHPATDFICTNDGVWFYNPNIENPTTYRFYYLQNGEVKHSYLPSKKDSKIYEYNWGPSKHLFTDYKGNIYMSNLLSNKIYKWGNGDLELFYDIDFHQFNIPFDIHVNELNIFEECKYAYRMNLFFCDDRIVFPFFCQNDMKCYYTIYDTKTEVTQSGIVSDSETNIPFFPQMQFGRYMVGVTTLGDIRGSIDKLTPYTPSNKINTISDDATALLFYSF